MNIQLSKTKIIALLFVLIFSANASAISITPFVGFQNEQLTLAIDSPEKVARIKILAQYDQRNVKYCNNNCPVFENDSTEILNPQKKDFTIFTRNSPTGNYVIKIDFNDGHTIFSSFEIKNNYAVFLAPIIVILLIILFWVEKHD
ncbi:MAG: hypothetical protein Q7S21_00165 [archaeon]|nr:hypothetical protein [archaeon]